MSDVKAAAEMLDREIPGWENLVEPEELEMTSCSSCVLGQIFGKGMEQKLNTILGGKATSVARWDNYFNRGRVYLEDKSPVVIAGLAGPFSAYQDKCEWVAEIATRRCREGVEDESVE